MRLRIALACALLAAVAMAAVVWLVLREVGPFAYKANEESLAETAAVLAAMVEARSSGSAVATEDIRQAMTVATRRDLAASIQDLEKRRVELRLYVTDAAGIVLFDSDEGRDEGRDYSRWNDVARTLHGRYGARATRSVPDDPFSSVHYVAAPIHVDGRIVGVLSVGKPVRALRSMIARMKYDIAALGVIGVVLASLAGVGLAQWIAAPIRRLVAYATAVGAGERPRQPRLSGREAKALGEAVEGMRDALDGRRYVLDYVRDLTHEIKAPLSAVRAAAELLQEDMTEADRRRFVGHVVSESERMSALVDRMLELSTLEARRSITEPERVDLASLARDVALGVEPPARQKGLLVEVVAEGHTEVLGDAVLLRQAVLNLVQNALHATPAGGSVRIDVRTEAGRAIVRVTDSGPGVPAYALERVFDRFYSADVGGTGRPGTGLGLAIVREIAVLHSGAATLRNLPSGGAEAELSLPDAETGSAGGVFPDRGDG